MRSKTHQIPSQTLLPASDIGQKFVKWFSHVWDFIIKPNGEENWKTEKQYPLSARRIWQLHQNPELLIGLRFGTTTNYLVIDIDRHSPYHPYNNPKEFKRIHQTLEEIGLCRPILIQSSHSQGLHLYYFLNEKIPTFQAASLLRVTLKAANFNIKDGTLEIFPNVKSYNSLYKGLRLPLQPNSGSYLVDDDLNILSSDIEDLLNQAEITAAAQDLKTFKSLLENAYSRLKAQRSNKQATQHSNRQNDSDLSLQARIWKQALEAETAEGWTGSNQTNYLLIKITTYCLVFLKLQKQELRAKIFEIATTAPGYQQYCRHQHEIEKRISEICYYTEQNQHYLPYCSFPARSDNGGATFEQTYRHINEKTKPRELATQLNSHTLKAQQQILKAVALLEKQNKLSNQIVIRREQIRAIIKEQFNTGISTATLNKHQELWHPKHRTIETIFKAFTQSEETPTTPEPKSLKPVKPLPEQDLTTISTEKPPIDSQSQQPEPLPEQDLTTISPIYEVYVMLDPQSLLDEDSQLTDDFVTFTQSSLSSNLTSSYQSDLESLPILPFTQRANLLNTTQTQNELDDSLTPQNQPQKTTKTNNSQSRSRSSQPVPLNVQIKRWAKKRTHLVYTGNSTSGLVELKGEKHQKLRTIEANEPIVITDCNHSSFWFYPEDESKLLVYVKPLNNSQDWKEGVAVLAKFLKLE
jgi:hypothetical protein